MRVELLSTMASAAGSHPKGAVVDFPPAQASQLIKGGYAVALDEEVLPAPVVEEMPKEDKPSKKGK